MPEEGSKPRAVLVPFGYPDYPRDVVDRFIGESRAMVAGAGIEVVEAPAVIERGDIPGARAAIRGAERDFIIALIVSWVEAPNLVATLREFLGEPILLWSHTTYMEGAVRITLGPIPAAGVLRQTLEEFGARYRFTYGMPGDARVRGDLSLFARVSAAIRRLGRARVGLFGYLSMGMYTGGFDHAKVRRILGPEIVHRDQYSIGAGTDAVPDERVADLVRRARAEWDLAPEIEDADMARTMRMYLAIEELAEEEELDALTVKCQYELSREYGLAPCIPLSLIAERMPCSCEGDVPLILSQLILSHLTGGAITSYGDVHDVTGEGILLAACGFAPLSMASGRPRIGKHTALYEGLMNMSPYREGFVTLARVATDGAGYKLHAAGGRARAMPPYHEIGCPAYAGLEVALDGDVHDFMQNLSSQHYGLVYADCRAELRELCRLLGIRLVETPSAGAGG